MTARTPDASAIVHHLRALIECLRDPSLRSAPGRDLIYRATHAAVRCEEAFGPSVSIDGIRSYHYRGWPPGVVEALTETHRAFFALGQALGWTRLLFDGAPIEVRHLRPDAELVERLTDAARRLRDAVVITGPMDAPVRPMKGKVGGIPRSWRLALQSWESVPPEFRKTYRNAYDWLKESHDPDEYDLPKFNTWQKYVQRARFSQKMRSPRIGRTGRSIVRHDEI